ncbi:hypothetical protein KGD90_32045, partial [Rhodococcus qingshengii]|nr:hypothetical protein [Rhodococcus qingshengii]
LAAGATWAVCAGGGWGAALSASGWTWSGSAGPALGLRGACVVLVQAESRLDASTIAMAVLLRILP